MKKYRVVYWLGSIITDCCVFAHNEKEAIEMFKRIKGEQKIFCIEEFF